MASHTLKTDCCHCLNVFQAYMFCYTYIYLKAAPKESFILPTLKFFEKNL